MPQRAHARPHRLATTQGAASTGRATTFLRTRGAPVSAPPRHDAVHGGFDLNTMPAISASSSQSPHGHGLRRDYRVVGRGILDTPPHPVTGMIPANPAPDFIPHDGDCSAVPRSSHGPKMEFPKFDGENPRLWRDQCVLFFKVYGTHPAMKTRYAALNFKGAAATWLQMIERRGRITDWSKLCDLVFDKYDKDQYQQQLRQLEMLKQTSSVAEYHAQFEKLAHGILLYNTAYDDVYFVKSKRLQEEELAMAKVKPVGRGFTKGFDRNGNTKAADKTSQSDSEDKLASLKQFRRKNGLCFKCGGKWAPNHTCPDQVPIHVLEELWDALQLQDEGDSEEIPSGIQSADDTVLTVQLPNSETTGRRQTLKLLAHIGKQQVLVLVDSGSIGTFVSDRLVKTLNLPTEPCPLATFRAADGGQLQCSERVPALQW
ncbi:unnamed protein product [Miscanthus lutarioriparius]|uniref:Retrotransposon gag domain-containing protein n=1 Tax=Miscanthus lutarioriparius TaxID=422564 RepID=A0A811S0X9_9POAL|nr:unnamed protein product [Miscanthus lutarioriparius]